MDTDTTVIDGCRMVRFAGDETWLDCQRPGCDQAAGPFWSQAEVRRAARRHAAEHGEVTR